MIFRFEDYELDTSSCQLRRGGELVPLQNQPLNLLIFLANRPNQLVNRDEIAASLWGGTTFVDAEHGINTAIRKIRAALDDSPSNPRYIETVSRRGYRFKAALTAVPAVEPAVLHSAPVLPTRVLSVPPLPTIPSSWRWGIVAAVCGLGVAALILAIGKPGGGGPPKLRWTSLTGAFRTHTNLPLASDGKNVYWTEYDENGCRPLYASLAGSEPFPVRMPFPNAMVLDASADGHLLVNVRENCKNMSPAGPVWELDPLTGKARRLADFSAQAGGYGPNGRTVAFANGGELWIANRDGSGARRIVKKTGLIYIVRWSPDGGRIRFSEGLLDQQRYTLWETGTDGRNLRDLLADWKDVSARFGGVWSAAGGFIFEGVRHGSTDLWRLEDRGWFFPKPVIEQVTAGPLDFGVPAAIPGRSELLVAGTRKLGALHRYDPALRRFVPFLNGISAEMADFSRDGKWVAYVSYPDGQLWRSRADGSERIQLTQPPMRAGLPRISPDMNWIAFSAERPGASMRVLLIPFNGGAPREASAGDGAAIEVGPMWSPDSARLLYRHDQPDRSSSLEILDLASHRIAVVPDSTHRFNQKWSPDGQWIVATPYDETELDIYDVARRQWTVLARMNADYPGWSADGKFVNYLSSEEGASVYRVSLATRRPEFVASLTKFERAIDESWGQWVGLTPEGDPLVLLNADLQQIYLLSFESK